MDPEEWEQMVTISFDWEGDPKPVSTSFVGTYVKASLSHYDVVEYGAVHRVREYGAGTLVASSLSLLRRHFWHAC